MSLGFDVDGVEATIKANVNSTTAEVVGDIKKVNAEIEGKIIPSVSGLVPRDLSKFNEIEEIDQEGYLYVDDGLNGRRISLKSIYELIEANGKDIFIQSARLGNDGNTLYLEYNEDSENKALSIDLSQFVKTDEKGKAGGVATLGEDGIIPKDQLPAIPTKTSELENDSDFATNTSVDEKIAGLVDSAPEALDTLGELATALESHKDAYDALLEVVGNKANKDEIITDYNGLPNRPIINANLIGTSNPVAGTYYRHVGSTNNTYTRGVIYYYDGEKYIGMVGIQGKDRCVHYVDKDVFSVEQGASNLSMKWTLDDIDGITEPFAGMMASIQIPDTSSYGSGVVMSIDGGATYHPVLRNRITALTNAYQETVIVTFIYNPDLSTRVYLEDGVQTTITGCWQVADYDSDRLVQQNRSTVDGNFPVLCKVNTSNENTMGSAYFSPDITMNPKTGAVHAVEFYEDGVSLSEKYGGNEGAMPIIRLVKVSDMNRSGVVSPTNPIRVTIQVLSGTILPTDKIELCSKKSFTYKLYDEGPDATRKKGRRWRLRKITERVAEVCHPDKSFPSGMYRMICWDIGDDITPRAFLRSDNVYLARKWVTKYVRVSRMDSEGTIYHSNAVAFSFSIDNLLKPEKHTAKIHIN